MRRPPAAELVASVTRGANAPMRSSTCARAAATPTVTSPRATDVGATPCPSSLGVASPMLASPSKAETTVVVEPISATKASTARASPLT